MSTGLFSGAMVQLAAIVVEWGGGESPFKQVQLFIQSQWSKVRNKNAPPGFRDGFAA